jgi:hypothetical protein
LRIGTALASATKMGGSSSVRRVQRRVAISRKRYGSEATMREPWRAILAQSGGQGGDPAGRANTSACPERHLERRSLRGQIHWWEAQPDDPIYKEGLISFTVRKPPPSKHFVIRSGRRIAEADTDQAGSRAVVRTVSRDSDGAPIDRPQLCVSIRGFWRSGAARALAEALDRRDYLPPVRPMTSAEFMAVVDPKIRQGPNGSILWSVLRRGLPIDMALERHGRPNDTNRQRRL